MGPLFNFIAIQSTERDLIAAIVGLCVGSFLNVLANRTLAEKPLLNIMFGSSCCPKCERRLGVFDLIPIVSYILLNGKCRYCAKPISFQYPLVEFATAIAFIAIIHHFQIANLNDREAIINAVGLDVAMLTFFCILIAVTVTDFKEKLIPHEITYPSILVGIAFSASGRDDLMPSLAGIGISYILFDFLAFYGLKLYYILHRDEEDAHKLDRAVRATDGDMLATVPTAKMPKSVKGVASDQGAKSAINASVVEESARVHVPTIEPASEPLIEPAIEPAMAPSIDPSIESAIEIEIAAPSEPSIESSIEPPIDRPEPLEIEPTTEPREFPTLHEQKDEAITLKTTTPVKNAALTEPIADDEFDPEIDEAFGIAKPAPKEKGDEEEEFEVMGGGDAVMAALIAAWIGLTNLGLTLLFGFMFGSVMGAVYLCVELHKQGKLTTALKRTAIMVAAILLVSEGTVLTYAVATGAVAGGKFEALFAYPWITTEDFWRLPWAATAAASTFGGILMGTVVTGREGSKPFPFGPALAAGAMVAVFMDPTKSIRLSDTCVQFGAMLRDMGHN